MPAIVHSCVQPQIPDVFSLSPGESEEARKRREEEEARETQEARSKAAEAVRRVSVAQNTRRFHLFAPSPQRDPTLRFRSIAQAAARAEKFNNTAAGKAANAQAKAQARQDYGRHVCGERRQIQRPRRLLAVSAETDSADALLMFRAAPRKRERTKSW